jgi:Ca-activated chloride channel family protein
MRFLVVPAFVLIAASVVIAQQQEPTFKSGTRIVSVIATVIDAQGRLVPDLEQEDFTILDNGKPQTITFFEDEVRPFTAVVMLDFSLSMTANIELLKRASEQFLIRLLPQDKAQVGAFSDKIQFSGRFTSDRDDLIGALQELQFGNPTRLFDATYQSIDELKSIEGRRVVVVFTDGDDTASRLGANDVLDKAKDNETMIYAIGLESTFYVGGRMQRTRPDRMLRKFADETGGGYFELKKTDDLAPTFTRVAQELHSQYTIGFAPTVLDGKEHKLELKVKPTGMTARGRKSYIASTDRLQ